MPTLTKAPSPKTFANAWTKGFAAAVKSEAGTDGRLSKKEAERIAQSDGPLAQYGDNAVNYLERTGQKSVSVNKLIGKAHNYAEAVAEKASGNNQRLSLLEARSLPDDIRGDFFALRGKEDPTAIGGSDKLTGSALTQAFDNAAKGSDGYPVEYISEGDYPLIGTSMKNPENLPLNGETVMKLYKDMLTSSLFDDDVIDDYAELTSETFSPAETKEWIAYASEYDVDTDDYYKEMNAGFARVNDVLSENLDDVRVIKVGRKDDDGSLAESGGTYAYFIVGKAEDGSIAGIHFGAAET